MNDAEYIKYSKKTDKIANIGKTLAFSGFLTGAADYTTENILPNNIRLFAGVAAGASFITGLILIAVAQSRHQKVMHECVDEIGKIVSGTQQKVRG